MRKTLAVAIAVAVTAVVAPGMAAAGMPSSQTPGALRWGPCPADAVKPGLECATVRVPLDYRHPKGRQIDIEISRLAGKNPGQRRGVLLTNPGGPGGAGLTYPVDLANPFWNLPKSVLDGYDLIGFDPRGVGHSTPVRCDLTAEQLAKGNFPSYANTPADVVREAAYAKKLAEQCATSETADLLPFITTANTARDMDRIREALGEKKISYLGASYGTYLGAVYTTLFPQRSDRIVLDSSLGPNGYDVTAFRNFARGMEERFPDFAKFATADNAKYGLGTTPEQVRAKYFDLAARLDKQPSADGFTGMLFRAFTFNAIYSDLGLDYLGRAWHALDTGQPVPVLGGGEPAGDPDNGISSNITLVCNDSRWPRSIEAYQRAVEVDRAKYPMLGGSTGNIKPCAFWPTPVEAPVRITGHGPSNVLIVQNLRDPGTPLVGAKEMERALGDRARMITVDHGGHGVYPFDQNACANDKVSAFLAGGSQLPQDAFCAA